eukprot:m.71610 g.71610  ORF g.71610 m.71610 type:complete len:345 (-) comp24370_c0_seq1:281-1315(-)
MDADGIPIVGSGIDFTNVKPIKHKRTVTFLNHFIAHTASFLNRFSTVCEEKLETIAFRLQRLEITVTILEEKLASIPSLNEEVTVEPYVSTTIMPPKVVKKVEPEPKPQPPPTTSTPAVQPPPSAPPPATTNIPPPPPSTGVPVPPPPPPTSGAVPVPPPPPPMPGSDSVAPPPPSPPDLALELPDLSSGPPQSAGVDPRYAPYFKMIKMGVHIEAVKTKCTIEGLDPSVLDNPNASVGGGGGGGGDSVPAPAPVLAPAPPPPPPMGASADSDTDLDSDDDTDIDDASDKASVKSSDDDVDLNSSDDSDDDATPAPKTPAKGGASKGGLLDDSDSDFNFSDDDD